MNCVCDGESTCLYHSNDRQPLDLFVFLQNAYGERRTLTSCAWAGDTCFYFDEGGLSYEPYPHIDGEADVFEQMSSGDRWSARN